jgi:hypothetical protein
MIRALLKSLGLFISAIKGMKEQAPAEELKILSEATIPVMNDGWAMTK